MDMNDYQKRVSGDEGHSMDFNRPCSVCGDMDGCHVPAKRRMEAEEATRKIREAAATGNVRFPANVEKHGIFPLKFKDDDGKYTFEYVRLRGGFPAKNYPDRPDWNHNGGFSLEWGAKGIGFGELTFTSVGGKKNEETDEIEDANIVCDSENMSRDFVKAALAYFADTVEIE